MFTTLTCRSALISFVCFFCLGSIVLAADPQRLDIPAGELSVALQTLTKQTGIELVYQSEAIKGVKTKGVSGTLSPVDALTKLLEGTGFKVNTDSTGAMLIAPQTARGSSSNRVPSPAADATTRVAQSSSASSQEPAGATGLQNSQEFPGNSPKVAETNGAIAEILVKGSRIMNVDIKRSENDAQPYTIFDSETLEQSGAVSVEDFLKQRLTMNTQFTSGSQSSTTSLGATSSINLRGLGTNETLILIDGRRSASVQSGFDTYNQPDINSIPVSAIERIEVLPLSASAIYGGAALGGVINIILKKQYEGGTVAYSREDAFDANAPLNQLNAVYGFTVEEGRTNVMVSGSYSKGNALLTGDRLNLVQRGLSTIFRNEPAFLFSPSSPFQGATPNIASVDGSNLLLKNGGTSLNSPITSVPSGALAGSNLDPGLVANAGTYNLNLSPGTGREGLQNPIGRVPVIKSFTATVRREMTPWLDLFGEFSTASNSTRSLSNPVADGIFLVPSTAPDSPFQQDVSITIPSDLTSIQSTDTVTHSVSTGLVARLPKSWNLELDYTWSRNLSESHFHSVDTTSLNSALATGGVNPFADTIAHPLSLAPYLSNTDFSETTFLDDVGLRASGAVGSLPWGVPTLTIGLEHRREGFYDGGISQFVYPLNPAQDLMIRLFGQAQSTDSLYAEALVPLVTAANKVPFLSALELQLAGRSERYTIHSQTPYVYLPPATAFSPPQGVRVNTEFTSTNPTFALKFKPVEDITFRVSYAKAFLPPTAAQLLPNSTVLAVDDTITDPKTGQTYSGVNEIGGGNPNLKPQTARAWDAGVIFQPSDSIFDGLRIDLEHYDIVQPNYITQPTAQQVVANPEYADRVTRDPATDRVTVVNTSYVNAEKYQTVGWDLALDYGRATPIGSINLHAAATLIQHDRRQYTIGGPFADYAGYPAEGGETKNKANLVLSWQLHQWAVAWSTTYFGGYYQALSPGSPLDQQFGTNGTFTYYTAAQGSYSIPSQIYHDFVGSFTFNRDLLGSNKSGIADNLLSNLSVQINIKNIFNTLPPFDVLNAPYYYSPYGDPRLRSYRLSVKKAF